VTARPLAAVRRRLGLARRRIGRTLAGAGDAPVVLMYHRIAAPRFDPWGLSVAPERFARQLAELKARRTVLPLAELVEQLEARRVAPRATAITFDDGYADNALVAKPLLEDMGLPATMFLTSGSIGSERAFWWDELAALVLGDDGAGDIELEIGGTRLAARWPAGPAASDRWRAWQPPEHARQAAYRTLWGALQHMAPNLRHNAMAALRERLASDAGRAFADALPMTAAMASGLPSELIAVGGHGRTHVPLTALSPQDRAEEIAGGREDLAALTSSPPQGFAYPHGSWDAATRAAVEQAGYGWAVTTREAVVDPRRYDRFAIPRMAVTDGEPAGLTAAIATLGV